MTEEVVKFLGGTALVLAAVGWLVRSLIGHFLSKDVESFKHRLQSESTVELERLRHSLRLVASEHEKQIHLLQERRAEVIAELYARLIEFLGAAESFASLAECTQKLPSSFPNRFTKESLKPTHRVQINTLAKAD